MKFKLQTEKLYYALIIILLPLLFGLYFISLFLSIALFPIGLFLLFFTDYSDNHKEGDLACILFITIWVVKLIDRIT